MNAERINRVKNQIQEENLDALVCRLPENVLFLSGHWPLCGLSFLVFPLEGKPVCIVPHCDEKEAKDELWEAECVSFLFGVLESGDPYADIKKALKAAAKGKGWKRIGYEGNFGSVAPPWNAAEPAVPSATTRNLLEEVFCPKDLIDATELLNSQRACKTSDEIDRLRIVNEISVFGLTAFCEKVAVGISGVELVAEVERTIMKQGTGYKGAKRVRAFAQVSTGATETVVGFRPMVISTPRKLEPGDIALLELGVVADGFWSDRTRVRTAGKPTEKQIKIFEIVKSAQETAIAKVQAGVTAREVDEVARAIIRDAGYEKEFLHVTGHGLGLRYHEPVPLICPDNNLVLQAGMVHTVEPGVYLPDIGGIRLEDNVVVTVAGREVLGPFKKELSE